MGSINRTAAKRDSNEREIIRALEAAGCTVEQLSKKGVADLLVGGFDPISGDLRNWLLEVKSGREKLTTDEAEWHEHWRGQVAVVRSIEEALEVIGR